MCKAYDIYLAKNEEGKLNYQKKNYHRCLENYNDIINYIDYELKCDNIFIEIEKNCNNELHIEVISDNYNFDKKKRRIIYCTYKNAYKSFFGISKIISTL